MTVSCTFCKTGTKSVKRLNKRSIDHLVAHMGIFPFSLPFFLEEMVKADAGQAATCLLLHLTGSEWDPTVMSQQEVGKWALGV